MSKFTTEVRYICESLSDETQFGFNNVNTIIQKSRRKIFDFDYPCFDNNYKSVLETKILRHYYTREICEETFGLWQLRLCDKMNLIMPYYNQLYNSELLNIEPFIDVNYERHKIATKTGQNTIDYTHDETKTLNNSDDRTYNNLKVHNAEKVDYGKVEAINGTDTDDINEHKTTTYNTTDTTNYSGNETVTKGGTETNVKSGSQTVTDGGTDSVTTSGVKWEKYSDTPQGSVTGLNNDNYLTNATKNTDETTDTTHHGKTETTNFNNVTDKTSFKDRVDTKSFSGRKDAKSKKGTESVVNTEDNEYKHNKQTKYSGNDNKSGDNITTGSYTD